MQRRVPAERGISAYQHEHTTSQWNGATVRRPLRTVPLVPLQGASDTSPRKESAQAIWSYVGDAENIMPVAPTAPSFSTGLDEAINEDGFMQPQAPLDHQTTGVHHVRTTNRMGAPTFPETDENTGVAHYWEERDAQGPFTPHTPHTPPVPTPFGATRESDAAWPTYGAYEEYEEEEEASPRYRRAYGSISPARLRRDDAGRGPVTPLPPTETGEMGMAGGGQPRPYSQPLVRTDALVGGYSGELAMDARYHPTTTPLASPYDQLFPMSALKRKRDTIFLMLLTLLVLSIIGIMSCNYLLAMYSA